MTTVTTPTAAPVWADFPTEEYQARVARAQRSMREHGLDVLLLTQKEIVQYFSGFLSGGWSVQTFAAAILLLHVSKDPVLVIPDIFAATARGSSWIQQHAYYTEPHLRPRGAADAVVDAVIALAGATPRIGLEWGPNLVAAWNLADYHAVRERLGAATFSSAEDVVWDCRMIKSPREIERMREITGITERAMVGARDQVHAGMTEQELARVTVGSATLAGADGIAFTNIRAGVDRYRMSDSVPMARPIRADEMVVFDIALTLRTYAAELACNIHIGEPTAKHREIWRTMTKAQDAALAVMRPGVRAEDVFHQCLQVLNDYGYGRPSAYSVGHGIGLSVHEPPVLGPQHHRTLEAGMVFVLGSWIYDIEGLGVFALEEMVAITDDGNQLLSTLPRDELWWTA